MAKEWAKRFYNGTKWKRCREDYINNRIMIDGGMCEHCQEAPGEELHHKTFLTIDNVDDPEISLNHDNLIWLCKDCHFKIHKEEIFKGFQMRKRKRLTNNGIWFDEAGDIHVRDVKIVYGSPCSGKTTYVMQHKEDSDMVIDIDYLKAALRGNDKRYKDDNMLGTALAVANLIYDMIESNHKDIDCKTVWIVGGFPKRKAREELARRLKAELIYMDVDVTTCIHRARELNSYDDKVYSEFVVENWWRNYEV